MLSLRRGHADNKNLWMNESQFSQVFACMWTLYKKKKKKCEKKDRPLQSPLPVDTHKAEGSYCTYATQHEHTHKTPVPHMIRTYDNTQCVYFI